jgi:hypothetical protein
VEVEVEVEVILRVQSRALPRTIGGTQRLVVHQGRKVVGAKKVLIVLVNVQQRAVVVVRHERKHDVRVHAERYKERGGVQRGGTGWGTHTHTRTHNRGAPTWPHGPAHEPQVRGSHPAMPARTV